jgi:Domain of Unknown Function (DUF1080)
MRLATCCFRLLAVTVLTCPLLANAAGDPKQATLDALKVDEDFPFQGEYEGTFDDDGDRTKYGVHIIALGDGKFDTVAYPGGLPGAGWTGEEKIKNTGRRSGSEVVIVDEDSNVRAVIRGGEIRVTIDGEEVGTLKRVERKSPTLGAKPPQGAAVLFAGREEDVKNFRDGARFENGHLRESFTSKDEFGDYTLHLEFMLSYMPYARGQGRSNSGVYQQGRYEVQVLDSFGLEGADNECGGVYKAKAPSVNMCLPPLQWQTYDVDFTAAKYDAAGQKTAPARMTVRHNGVVIHNNIEVPAGTPGGTQAEGPGPGPIHVQNHGNPLYFRNIWVAKK